MRLFGGSSGDDKDKDKDGSAAAAPPSAQAAAPDLSAVPPAMHGDSANANGFPLTTVESLDELIKAALRFTEHWPGAWFRGVHGDHGLEPTAFRKLKEEREEMAAFYKFRNAAPSFFERVDFNNVMDTLFLAQHHGVPTRLIDWSQSLGVAIYFALDNFREEEHARGARPGSDIYVWLLDPGFLNRLTRERWEDVDAEQRPQVVNAVRKLTVENRWDGISGNDKRPRMYAELAILPSTEWPKKDERNFPLELPIAFFPPSVDRRIMLQRGCFTLHGRRREPLDAQILKIIDGAAHTPLRGLRIPNAAVDAIEREFRLIGPTSTLIYGDAAGLARDIQRGT